jgi:4-hydroxybenzoate polyprenyltransferase
MGSRIIQFIFFANYFVGLLALALSVETAFQLGLPLASPTYYVLLFSATVLYYTYAYSGPAGNAVSINPRTQWYQRHAGFIRRSQAILLSLCVLTGGIILFKNFDALIRLPFYYWLMILTLPIAALLYYGLLPASLVRLNLRNSGWLKAFVIGYVWAVCVNFLPITMVRIEHDILSIEPTFVLWLFVKNWIFCTVNAIMFDMKDYADDANKQLKTFVVRFGLRSTIFYVLIPLLLIGLIAFLAFASYRHFGMITILFNMVPFLALLAVAYSLHQRRNILYYLIVIDGLLLIKALCGIAGSFFA